MAAQPDNIKDAARRPRLSARTCGVLAACAVVVLAILCAACLLWAQGARACRDARLADATYYEKLAAQEQAYLLSTQASDGALLYTPGQEGEADVVAYFSSLCALGLLAEGSDETKNERFAAVERYLAWYGAHLEDGSRENLPAGSICDYSLTFEKGVVNGETREDPDSVDSYAATYVLVLAAFANAGGSQEFLAQHADESALVLKALLGTLGGNGLSRVAPDNGTQYLMDNAEVLAALRAAPTLIERTWLPDATADEGKRWEHLSRECADAAEALEDAIERELWDAERSCWNVALDSSGETIPWEGWEEFYPSAVAQFAPAAFAGGFAHTDVAGRSRALFDAFSDACSWETFEHLDRGDASFYWSMLAYAAASSGDEKRARTYLEGYDARVTETEHAWPLYIADASWVARAASLLAQSAYADAQGADPLGLLTIIP